MENKIRLIDANATIEALAANFRQASVDGCDNPFYRIAEETVSEMPTITGYFLDTTEMEPLTLKQLQGMIGQPVWVQTPGVEKYGRWVIVAGVDTEGGQKTLYCQGDYTCRDYGKVWLAYAYPPAHIGGPCHACGYGGKHLDSPPCTTCPAHPKTPAHIDREAWKPCEKCVGCGNCNYFLYDDDESPCDKCLRGSTDEKPYPEFSPIAFCKHCGRPLTPEARAIQEKRLRG